MGIMPPSMCDANCNCAGTPTACTGIGDADGDVFGDDVDCQPNNPNIATQPGDACDDGDTTSMTPYANCFKAGTPTACDERLRDADGDGVCTMWIVSPTNSNIATQLGSACDDGDNTLNDTVGANR